METLLARRIRQQNLTNKQSYLVVGSMLGDGHLVKTTSGYAFRVNHGLQQQEYVDWKYQIIKDFVTTAPKASGKTYYFRTVTHPEFDYLRKRFYEDHKKVVNKELLEEHLNSFTLAVWIMDDGTKEGKQLRINSQNFSRDENILLAEILRAKLGIETTLNRDKSYWRLRIKAESMPRLREIIRPYFIPSMLYKLSL